jgi:hypothetical protein
MNPIVSSTLARHVLAGAIAVAIHAKAAAAQPTILDFVDTCGGAGELAFGPVWVVGAYRFTFSYDNWWSSQELQLLCAPQGSFASSWTGIPQAYTSFVGPESMTLDRVDGRPFTIASFDVLPLNSIGSRAIFFNSMRGGAVVGAGSTTVSGTMLGTRQTILLDSHFAGIDRFVYSANYEYGWTNFKLTTTPEPNVLVLAATGLLASAFAASVLRKQARGDVDA